MVGIDTYTAVLSACGTSSQWQQAALVFEDLEQTGTEPKTLNPKHSTTP